MKTLFKKIVSLPDRLLQELKSIKDEIAAARDTYKSVTDEKKTQPIVHVLSRAQTERDEDERRYKEQRGYQNRNLWVNGIYTLVTAVIACATIVSAIVSYQSVKVSKKSAEATLRQSRLEQRAWIVINVVPVSFNPFPQTKTPIQDPLQALVGQAFSIRTNIKNIGRTPAYNVRKVSFEANIHVPKGTLPNPTLRYQETDFQRIGALMPEAGVFSDSGFEMTQKAYEDIVSQKLLVYDWGRIEYDDAYGVHHWYNFCQFMTTGGAFAQCPTQNDTDTTQD